MAEDATAAATPLPPEPSAEDSLTAPRKRRRLDGECGDLRRVAEIVMVLATMGQMRGGREPTAVERSLVAEARQRLMAACASLRPNDLFTSEAARIVAADLGFCQQMGVRPSRKVSIAEKVALTRKKMVEGKEFPVQASATPSTAGHLQGAELRPVPQPQQHHHQGLQKVSVEKPNVVPQAVASFHTVLPVGQLIPSTTWKQMPFGEARTSSASIGKDTAPTSVSSAVPVRVETLQFRSDARPGVPSYPFQVQAVPSGNLLPAKNIVASPVVLTSVDVTRPPKSAQVVKSGIQTPPVVEGSHEVSVTQTFPPATKHQSSSTYRHTVKVTASNDEQFPQSANVPHPSVNIEIAKSVHKLLQTKPIDLSSWVQPSLDYMAYPVTCQICKVNITDVESLLVCDSCEKGVHLRCLKSFNQKAITNQEWHCPKCMLASNGRMLPPKYGKVTRSSIAPKSSSGTGGEAISPEKKPEIHHVSLDKGPQNFDPKVCHEKVPTGVKTRSSLRTGTRRTNASSLEQQSDEPLVNADDSQGSHISSHIINTGNSSDVVTDNDQKIDTDMEDQHSDQERKNLGLSPCSMKESNPEFTLDLKTESLHNMGELHATDLICNGPENVATAQTGSSTDLPVIIVPTEILKDTCIKTQMHELEAPTDDASVSQDQPISSHSFQTGNSSDKDACSGQIIVEGREQHFGQVGKNLISSPCSMEESNSEFALDLKTDPLHTLGDLSSPVREISNIPENIDTFQAGNNTGLPISSLSTGIPKDTCSMRQMQELVAPAVDTDTHGRDISSHNIQTGNSMEKDTSSDQKIETHREETHGRDISSDNIHPGNSMAKDTSSDQKIETHREETHSDHGRGNLGSSPCRISGSHSELTSDLKTESLHSFGRLPTTDGEMCNNPEAFVISQQETPQQ